MPVTISRLPLAEPERRVVELDKLLFVFHQTVGAVHGHPREDLPSVAGRPVDLQPPNRRRLAQADLLAQG